MAPANRKTPQRSTASESTYSLAEFMRDFPDDETCLRWLWMTRYAPDGEHAFCPRCQDTRSFRRYDTKQQRQSWTCTVCSLHIHPTAGTIFHKSSTSLHLWFYAMYLMTSTRCGIAAKHLERELGCTYKTAWRMSTLIRNVLMTEDAQPPLNGVVELNETYIGGKPRAEDRALPGGAVNWMDRKTQVFGAVERNRLEWIDGDPKPTVAKYGRITAHVIPSRRKGTLMAQVERNVDPDSVVYTDSAHAYTHVPARKHETINHNAKVYVSGLVHTQTIDGFWGLVKTGIIGNHHAISPKWLQGYLNGYVWRYNRREPGTAMFLLLLLRAAERTAY
jgi:transposase-like protein